MKSRKLTPEEYSEDRKAALKELEEREKEHDQQPNNRTKSRSVRESPRAGR